MKTAGYWRPGLAGLFMASALCAPGVQAAPSERLVLCKGTPPARQDQMIVVDSAFRRLHDDSLRVGTIDFSFSRHVDGQFFIVSPLGSSPAAGIDPTKIHSAIDMLAKCADKTVFGLSFDFDDSALPAGAFSLPLSVSKEGAAPDDTGITASAVTVVGSVRRAWISAELSLAKAGPPGLLELRLTNTGDIASAALMFAPLADGMTTFRAGTNACQGRPLGAAESCRIDVAPPTSGAGDGQFEWPVEVGPHAGLTLRFERHDGKLGVAAQNR
jgi:hypothetical protein